MITKKAQDELFKDPIVVALWTEDGKLLVGAKSHGVGIVLPSIIEGLKVKHRVVGEIKALLTRKDKHRPAPGGVSIGHYNITAGTLGGICLKDDERLILSNNHVLADSNQGKIGDEIHQPGPKDQGGGNGPGPPCPFAKAAAAPLNLMARMVGSKTQLKPYRSASEEFLIGHLAEFIPIDFTGGRNRVDCALARPLEDGIVLDEILEIGLVRSFGDVVIGDRVRKSGRTTELSGGIVAATDGVVWINYGGGLRALFENQIITNNMLSGGDSGSWLIKGDANVLVGLCYAGSDEISIMNKSSDVKEALGIEL